MDSWISSKNGRFNSSSIQLCIATDPTTAATAPTIIAPISKWNKRRQKHPHRYGPFLKNNGHYEEVYSNVLNVHFAPTIHRPIDFLQLHHIYPRQSIQPVHFVNVVC